MTEQMNDFYSFFKDMISRKNVKELCYLGLIALLHSSLLVIIPLIQKGVIDSIMKSKLYYNSIVAFLVLSIVLSLLVLIEIILIVNIKLSIQKNISFNMLYSIIKKENKIIKTRGSGAFMSGLFGDAEQISMLYEENFFFNIGIIISCILILLIAASWSWIFPTIVISSYILMTITINITKKYHREYFSKAREYVFSLNPKMLEFIENRKTIMSYTNIDNYLIDIKGDFNKRDYYFKKVRLASEFGTLLLDSIKSLALVIFFILSMVEILNSRLELTAFITMTSYFSIIFMPMNIIKKFNDSLNKFEMLYKRNEDTFNYETKSKLPENNSIKINNLSFGYEGNNILKDISLDIDKLYGVVGISGEGKTSFLKLLTGEIIPSSGEIIYGNENIKNYPMPIIYSGYRIYSQEPEIFDNDLKFNIVLNKKAISELEYRDIELGNSKLFFKLYNSILEDDIKGIEIEHIKLLKNIYNLLDSELNDDFIIEIKKYLSGVNILELSNYISKIYTANNYYIIERYDNLISDLDISYLNDRDFGQRGNKISGGEKNKIALGRFLLSDIDLPVIIDEPFTSLDAISEENNLNIMKKYLKNPRGILVSHKLNIINSLSDEILIMENGSIEDRGNHSELLEENDLYKSLYEKYIVQKNI